MSMRLCRMIKSGSLGRVCSTVISLYWVCVVQDFGLQFIVGPFVFTLFSILYTRYMSSLCTSAWFRWFSLLCEFCWWLLSVHFGVLCFSRSSFCVSMKRLCYGSKLFSHFDKVFQSDCARESLLHHEIHFLVAWHLVSTVLFSYSWAEWCCWVQTQSYSCDYSFSSFARCSSYH